MKNKKAALLLCLALLLSFPRPAYAAQEPSPWAAGEVSAAIQAGIVPADFQTGYDRTVTRGEAVKLILQSLRVFFQLSNEELLGKFDRAAQTGLYTDTSDSDALVSNALGLVGGTSATTFSPDLAITRAQAAVILARASAIRGIKPNAIPVGFSDAGDFPDYARDGIAFISAVRNAGGNPVMSGSSGLFDPGGVFTREQLICAVYRLHTTPAEAKAEMAVPNSMVYVRGGTFTLGKNISHEIETDSASPLIDPPHEVTVSDYYISNLEVTQKQFAELTGYNPVAVTPFAGDNLPVFQVTWYDAVTYCNKLSGKNGLKPVYTITEAEADETGSIFAANVSADYGASGYRLPSEAEWVYAASGGGISEGYAYAGGNVLEDVAWYAANAYETEARGPRPVGSKSPNELGLYDMTGNVSEWCGDWYGGDYFSNSPANDPMGPDTGTQKMRYGGSWITSGEFSLLGVRGRLEPGARLNNLGFRVARGYDGLVQAPEEMTETPPAPETAAEALPTPKPEIVVMPGRTETRTVTEVIERIVTRTVYVEAPRIPEVTVEEVFVEGTGNIPAILGMPTELFKDVVTGKIPKYFPSVAENLVKTIPVAAPLVVDLFGSDWGTSASALDMALETEFDRDSLMNASITTPEEEPAFMSGLTATVSPASLSLRRPEDQSTTDFEALLSSFYIGKYPVTQREFSAVMGYNPSQNNGPDRENHPAEKVTFYEAVEFCNRLSDMYGYDKVYTVKTVDIVHRGPNGGCECDLGDGCIYNPGQPQLVDEIAVADYTQNGFRLPTEAEWEYAARGGPNRENFLYSGSDNLDEVAWHGAYTEPYKGENIYQGKLYEANKTYGANASSTMPVGLLAPNSLGIYDMTGNVNEWCVNFPGLNPDTVNYAPVYDYAGGAVSAYRNDIRHGIRGGAFMVVENASSQMDVFYKYNRSGAVINNGSGFRVARSVPGGQVEDMTLVHSGGFTMGTSDNSKAVLPRVLTASEDSAAQDRKTDGVKVSLRNFYMGETQVTQREFEKYMGFNPSRFKNANGPVENVTWYDAAEFCNRKSQAYGFAPFYSLTNPSKSGNSITYADVALNFDSDIYCGFRLPSEAEWLFAARGGALSIGHYVHNVTSTRLEFPYAGSASASEVAWHSVAGSNMPPGPQSVGMKKANELGLFDMSGNVSEWCGDWRDAGYAWLRQAVGGAEPVTSPFGAETGNGKVIMGGSWADDASGVCIAPTASQLNHQPGGLPENEPLCKASAAPGSAADTIGFRVVFTGPRT